MSDTETLGNLVDQLTQIAELDVGELAERKSLGDLNFGEIKELLDQRYAIPRSFFHFR